MVGVNFMAAHVKSDKHWEQVYYYRWKRGIVDDDDPFPKKHCWRCLTVPSSDKGPVLSR